MNDRFIEQVVGARTYLVIRYPFYSYLLHRASIEEDPSIETACVNRHGKIRINAEFFDELQTPLRRAFVLAHEILHPAFGVFWRGARHHPSLCNIAHDYVINWILAQENKEWLPKGCLYDERFAGMAYEEVYYLLKSELPIKDVDGQSVRVNRGVGRKEAKGAVTTVPIDGVVDEVLIGGLGADIDRDSDGEGGGDEETDWGTVLARAAEAARMTSRLPDHLKRIVGGLLEPTIPWQEKLKMAVVEVLSKTRVDWTTPHRRSESYGYYAPREEYLGFDVSICVDTSGSISADELRRAVSEIDAIVRETSGEGRYIVGDAAVHADVSLKDFQPDLLEGGGGTSFVPHFEHLERYPTKLCVFFTDTFGQFPENEPDFPVIWAVYKPALSGGASVPFGEIVEVEV